MKRALRRHEACPKLVYRTYAAPSSRNVEIADSVAHCPESRRYFGWYGRKDSDGRPGCETRARARASFPRALSTAMLEGEDRSASLALAFEAAGHVGIATADARSVAREVGVAAAKWREVARSLGALASERDRMGSAFEHEDATLAR